MVLFMGEYYIARSYGEEKNAIAEWYDSENCNTLVIIDEYLRIERYKEMREDMNIGITWLKSDSKPGEGKVIFINEAFDNMTQDFILEHWATVGFFSG